MILSVEDSEQVNGKTGLRVSAILGNRMVLQSGRPIAMWGWTGSKRKVEIRCGWSPQIYRTTADADGRWRMELVAMPSTKGLYTMSMASDGRQIELIDAMFGEVWLCSGQSNMHMATNASTDAKSEVTDAEYPDIRFFKVLESSAKEALSDASGTWVKRSAESARKLSAVGCFFGRELHRRLKVPIGMIQSTVGGTPVEAWTSCEALRADPLLGPILTTWERWIAEYPSTLGDREAIALANEAKLRADGKTDERVAHAMDTCVELFL
jgi:sialate O-acetylesterase